MDEKTERWLKWLETETYSDGDSHEPFVPDGCKQAANLLRALLEERDFARQGVGRVHQWNEARNRVNAILAEIPDA